MKAKIRFKSVKSRLLAAFTVVILLVAGLGTYTVMSLKTVNNKTKQIIEHDTQLMAIELRLSSNMTGRMSAVRAYLLWGDESYKDSFTYMADQVSELQEEAKAIGVSEEFNELSERTLIWSKKITHDVLNVYESGQKRAAIQNLDKLSLESRELIEEYNRVATNREIETGKNGAKVIETGKTALLWTIVVTLLVAVISIIAALITSNVVTKPIHHVMTRMKIIANGDLSQEPLEVRSHDEVGQLAESMNDMSANIRTMLNEIDGVSSSVSGHSEELTQSSSEVNTATAQIAATMQELTSGIESEANTASELAVYMEEFTAKVEEANQKGEAVKHSSENVLSQTTTGAELMKTSSEQMKKIDGIVQDAVVKIKGLDLQTQEISKLVVVIKDIADQTNLLALNAAIEAARAGEHGKGFAVVADEVRNLAEQVAVSVKDITDIVGNIQLESGSVASSLESGYAEVEKGTVQLQTTSQTFAEISDSVNEVGEFITVMSTNLSEISNGSEKMSKSIEEIAAIAEESAAGVEQTSAASQQTSSSMEEVAGSSAQLAHLAEDLSKLVRKFTL
ncbi:methyl-accepting chemotaxis protein [Sporosarcina sp.]|uniref:methyl-accepting chemotaxis protein n=1 Tax=Sporosarcina sp. TaxID=49982 RepID=UPI002630B231|nr:methyl-accepting chemotaxis protein [Sporosarcina sp.]